ncbi:TRL-like family protein [Helicobacter sp. 16-1353]|uniref:TRL-like family protein n=1 Tax=Helicobacter sp. 16-1353 TaxID=2004996 RepID=UPI001C65F793|nr:TRL-like family protein [Helicobacter sp. 16-1353]
MQSPLVGIWYTNVTSPITATEASIDETKENTARNRRITKNSNNPAKTLKRGEAVCSSVLGIVASGDCSIQAAKKNGNITKVHSVDVESFSVLGFYASYTTIVIGE